MFQRLRHFILERCPEDDWITKAELYHATDTQLPPEFFRRWFELKVRRPETPISFRASVVSNTTRDLVRSGYLRRKWIDEPGKPGSRWKVRLTRKGAAKVEELQPA